jgi:group I intron endonuclease
MLTNKTEVIKMTCGLYCLTNKINGKKYFGQSINIEKRKKKYFNYGDFPNDHIKNAFNKYGKENFDFKIIKVCKEKYLDRFEKLYIRINDTQNPDKGYNKESGGNPNKTLSEETRQKMSEAQYGENNNLYRHDLNDDEIIRLYCDEKLSPQQIASMFNTDHKTIRYRLKKHDIELRDDRDKSGKSLDLDDDEIVRLYVDEGLSTTKIGDMLNVSWATINKRLDKMGIERDAHRDVYKNNIRVDLLLVLIIQNFVLTFQKLFFDYSFCRLKQCFFL